MPKLRTAKNDIIETPLTGGVGSVIPINGYTIEAEDRNTDTATVKKIRAQKFVELVKSGKLPKEAAKEVGIRSMNTVRDDVEIRVAVEALIKSYELPADIRKKLVRATANRILLEGESEKVQLEAAKLISEDPEIGLKGPNVAVQNNFNLSETTLALLDSIDVTPAVTLLPETFDPHQDS